MSQKPPSRTVRQAMRRIAQLESVVPVVRDDEVVTADDVNDQTDLEY